MVGIPEVKDIFAAIADTFEGCIESLSRISEDTVKGQPLIRHPAQFYNYDAITGNFYRQKPRSPDMILFKEDTIVFVEFKSGKIKSSDIKVKAIEGGFIILHKIVSHYKKEISFIDIIHLKKVYIVVYDKDKNARKHLLDHKYANVARFGLEMYKGTFFHKVKTLSKDRFMVWLEAHQLINGNA